MDKKQTIQIMGLLRAAYPKYYADATQNDIENSILLWHTMLKEHDFTLVGQALKAVLATNHYPPSVSDIIEKINELKTGEKMGELEAWHYVWKAVSNSGYHAQEEWEKLPEQLQKMISPQMLREWAHIEVDDFQTVVQSNFMRAFRAKQEQIKKYDALPQSVKDYTLALSEKMKMLTDTEGDKQ